MLGEIITKKKHPEIVEWLNINIYNYYDDQEYYTLTKDKKINAYCGVKVKYHTTQIKYPFGYVDGYFSYRGCEHLTSLIGAPETVRGVFYCLNCKSLTSLIGFPKYAKTHIDISVNKISNIPNNKKKYNLYIDMWYELLESVSEKDKWEYINNYQDKIDYAYNKPIIPKEIINKYKIDFLLKK